MRICWLGLGDLPNYAKLKRYGAEGVAFDIRDNLLRERQPDGSHYLDSVVAQMAVKPRLYIVQSWYPHLSPEAFAEEADRQMKSVGWKGNPELDFDIEKGAPLNDQTYVDFVVRALRRWRQLRPTRGTVLTLEGFQGGLFNNRYNDVVEIANRVDLILPQNYHGDMTPHHAGLVQNLTDYGFPREKVRVFFDAALVQEPWDGWIFLQSRLP